MTTGGNNPTVRPYGENFVWLSAMGLATGILMVISMLLLIFWKGVNVFWPREIAVVQLVEGSQAGLNGVTTFAGAIVHEREKLSRDPVTNEYKDEYKFFIGNKDIYRQMYYYVDKDQVASIEKPATIMMAERMEFGHAIFYPKSLTLENGEIVSAELDHFETVLQERLAAVTERRKTINQLEKKQIGTINRKLESIRLEKQALQRKHGSNAADHPKMQSLVARDNSLHEDYVKLAAISSDLRDQQKVEQLTYQLVTGEEKSLPLGDIVEVFKPNAMGLGEKLLFFCRQLWGFHRESPREANTEGGVFPAIFGTFAMTILMSALVMPFGVLAAIYLREYAQQGIFVQSIRIAINNLAGVPSIVYGVFGLGFFVYGVGGFIDGGPTNPLSTVTWTVVVAITIMLTVILAIGYALGNFSKLTHRALKFAVYLLWLGTLGAAIICVVKCPFFHGFFPDRLPTPTYGTGGIFWAAFTLAIMTVPVVVVATEEALAAVPRGMREASLACGASKWQTIQRVVMPASASGIITGLILAMARGAGEVAPLMLVGVIKLAPDLPIDLEFPFVHLDRKFMHLGFHIYDLSFQSPDSEAARPMVFATTFLLIMIVVVLNLGAILIRDRLRRKYASGTF